MLVKDNLREIIIFSQESNSDPMISGFFTNQSYVGPVYSKIKDVPIDWAGDGSAIVT